MFSQGQFTTSTNLDDFILQDKIGSGSFGKVYRVKDKHTKEIFAAKISINAINKDTYDLFMSISREVSIISKLNHPSILKFIIYSPVNFKKKMKPVIITEYAPNGSLMDLIEHDRSFPDNQILNDTHKLIIIYGIASAMSYLHSHDILHRDLKPDNVLIDNSFLPKVADFGLSKNNIKNSQSILKQTIDGTLKGTPKYMSPEIWLNAEYSKSSDVYAFAVTIYEIITLQKPFQDMNIYRVAYEVQKGERPKIDDNIPKVYINLIKRCWSQESSKRPTFDQIITEMKTNKEYLLDTVNENDFLNYIKFIDNYKITFNSNKSIVPTYNLNKYILCFNKENEIKDNVLIQNIKYISSGIIHFPWKYLKELSEKSMEIVNDAENGDVEKQYKVGVSLIEGRYDFPIDVEIGINFLKSSMNKGYKESFFYYIEMLIKGKYIPQNHVKARKLIENHFSQDKSSYFYLLGKLYKKQNLYKEAAESFMKSIKEGSIESLSQYAELLEKEGENKTEDFYKKGIEHGDLRCIFKYGVKLKSMKEKSKQEEGERLIKEAVEKGYNKAIYYYGTELEKEEDDDDIDNEYDIEETDYKKYKEKNRKEEDINRKQNEM